MKYRSLRNWKYALVEDETTDVSKWIQSHPPIHYEWRERPLISLKEGSLTVYAEYAWDGPSGPTIDTANFMRGSLVHDALYQLMRRGLLPQSEREGADKAIRDLCIEDGMSRVRAWWVYQSLRLGGGAAAKPRGRQFE